MKKLNILHYIPGFNTGGIESVFLSWFRTIDREKVNFELLVRSYDPESPFLKEYLQMGGVLHCLETPKLSAKTMLGFRKKVIDFFKQHHNYDFLHLHVADDPFVIATARKCGIKQVAIHAHTTGYNETYKSQGIKGYIRNSNVKAAQHYLAITQVAADWMFPKAVIGDKKVTIIHNGIQSKDYQFNQALREQYRDELNLENDYVLMHVGRFSEVKNHLFMIDIFENIKLNCADAKLVFIGDGPLFDEIKEKIIERNLQLDILLLGSRGDIPHLLQAADVFLLPSKFEGLGLSAIESQAAGLPTVVSDCLPKEVAITNLVHFLSLNQPSDEWADKLLEVGASREKKEMYQAFIDAHYEIKQTTADLIQFYRDHN